MDLEQLRQFLIKSNVPHATGTAKMSSEKDGSRTIVFADGDWSMHDNFFGGEPYGGRQIIHYQEQPAWLCVYYGRVQDTVQSADAIYDFLREALQHPPEDSPYRGPASYKKGEFEYQNRVEGSIGDFSGKEVILENGKQVYWAKYFGGTVDQRFKGSV